MLFRSYFLGMMGLQTLYLLGEPQPRWMVSLLTSLALSLSALGVLTWLAWMTARTTLYTLTSKRVVMRIGIVLTLTFNLPLRQLAAAGVKPLPDGHGDIALTLAGEDRIAWLNLWPHARPWVLKHPQPCLRCVPHAARVGEQLVDAWRAANPHMAAMLGDWTDASVTDTASANDGLYST